MKSVDIEKAAQGAAVPPVPSPVGSLPPGALPKDGEFRVADVPLGGALLVGTVSVFNVAGRVCATQANCTHRGGPLNEGVLDGSTVTCPYHGARFDVCTGAVVRGPARESLKTYQVDVQGDIGRLHEG